MLSEAERYYTAGKYDKAVEAYTAVANVGAENAYVHQRLAQCLNRLGRFEEAAHECKRALELDPELVPPYAVLGNIALRQQRFEESTVALKKAIELDPAYEETYVSLGAALIQQEEYQEAISIMQRALELDPRKSIIHQNLSIAYDRRGCYSKAFREAWHAFKLGPSFRTGESALLVIQKYLWRYRLLYSLLITALLLIPFVIPSALTLPLFVLVMGYFLWHLSLDLRAGKQVWVKFLVFVFLIMAYTYHRLVGL